MSKNTILSEEQKSLVVNEWNNRPDNPPSLQELVQLCYPDQNLDGRSKEGRAIKEYLSTMQIKARGAQEYVPIEKPELTGEQKEFIDSNCSVMKAVELARVAFKNPEITNLNIEARIVDDYLQTLPQSMLFEQESDIPDAEEYKPPKTFDRMMYRINRYVMPAIDKNKISPAQKKGISACIGYVNTFRFTHQINSYDSAVNRELFESCFIRYSYDKYDLSQEEVDQYIVLSAEVVIASNIQRRINHLSRLLDDTADDSDGRRISMSLVDAINTAQTEYNQCINRQQKLLSDLKQKRSDKLKNQLQNNASILNLVELWKEQETREKMVKLAELRKKTLKDEVQRLSDMDELKSRVLGMSEDEVLNG